MRTAMIFALVGLIAVAAEARTYRLEADEDWFSVLHGDGLRPGDEVVLSGGTYSDGRRLELGHRGTREKPITIRGKEGEIVVFQRPDARQNSMNLAGCQYLVLKDFEITGGDAAIRIGKAGEHLAKFLVIENLHIHHIGGVGITANYPDNTYERLVFRGNHIHHTGGHGEGFYLGCNNEKDGSTPGYIFDSVVEGNYIHDLKGGSVSQGDGIELKDGSYGNLVRDNVIHDTNYPGVIVYGTDGNPPNVIERNAIWNTGDHGIQAAADAVIRNNVIHSTGGDGIRCQDHQSAVVGNLTIVHNTILSRSPLRIDKPGEWSGKVVVANNAFGGAPRVPEGDDEVTQEGNVTGVEDDEVFPSRGSDVIGGGERGYEDVVVDDFNGTPRAGSRDAGAYVYDARGNPGWEIVGGFKRRMDADTPSR